MLHVHIIRIVIHACFCALHSLILLFRIDRTKAGGLSSENLGRDTGGAPLPGSQDVSGFVVVNVVMYRADAVHAIIAIPKNDTAHDILPGKYKSIEQTA